jgi:hypothetical protein
LFSLSAFHSVFIDFNHTLNILLSSKLLYVINNDLIVDMRCMSIYTIIDMLRML